MEVMPSSETPIRTRTHARRYFPKDGSTQQKGKVEFKNAVFYDVTPCDSCNSRRFGGTYRLNPDDKNL
jgi:hypothetical protein